MKYILLLLITLLSFNVQASVETWESLNYKPDSKLKNFLINADINTAEFKKYDVSSSFDEDVLISNVVGNNSTLYFLDNKSRLIIFSLIEKKILNKIDLSKHKNSEVAGLAYNNDYVYIAFTNGTLLAFSLITNSINWETKLLTPITSTPQVSASKIFVVSYNILVAIDKNSGKQIWNILGSRNGVSLKKLNSPTIYGGYVLAGLFSSDILVANEENGALLWRNNLVGSNLIGISPNPLLGDIKGSIVVDDNKALVLSNNKSALYKINNGELLWSKADITSYNTPVIINNYAYLVDINGYFLQVNMINGNVEYKVQLTSLKKVKEKVYWHTPMVINNSIVINSSFGDLLVIAPSNGKILSQKLIYKGSKEKLFNSGMILQNNLIYYGSKGNLYISR